MMILPHPGAGLANERNVTLNGEPCRRSRLTRSGSGEPVNDYQTKEDILMERKMFSVLLALFFVIGISSITIAEMGSENYSIPTSVLSGGGAPMSSGSYQTNSTLGQSSPLTDPADPPGSVNYDLYPSFW